MAVTFVPTPIKVWSIGDRKAAIISVAHTGTYTDNGDALSAATLGFEVELNFVQCEPSLDSPITGAFVPVYDHANGKVAFLNSNGASPAALLETPAGTNLGTRTFRMFCIGKGKITGPAS